MDSPDANDNRRFKEAIEHIQREASKQTLEAMEKYYFQLVLKLQTKRNQITQKLQKCRQQLQKLIKKEEWTDKQRADEEAGPIFRQTR